VPWKYLLKGAPMNNQLWFVQPILDADNYLDTGLETGILKTPVDNFDKLVAEALNFDKNNIHIYEGHDMPPGLYKMSDRDQSKGKIRTYKLWTNNQSYFCAGESWSPYLDQKQFDFPDKLLYPNIASFLTSIPGLLEARLIVINGNSQLCYHEE
jgi:hypothetical protein